MSSIRLDINHLHQPAREQAGTIGAVEHQPLPKADKPGDLIQIQNANALECIVPSESAVRMIPAIQNAFASLSQGDGRGGDEQRRQQRQISAFR